MNVQTSGAPRRRSRKTKAKAPAKASKRDHVAIAAAFARDVLTGAFPAGAHFRAAVVRQNTDLGRQGRDFPFVFDPEVGAKACRFLELLPHVEGPKKGKAAELEPWQVWAISTAYGWVNKVTGYPRFRRVTLFMPKGQGKTFLGAGLAIHTLATGDLGEKVFSAATTREQASLSFQTARMMLNLAPDVRDHFGLVVEQHRIMRPESGSYFKPVSSEANSVEGILPAFILEDEIHAHSKRDLHDNLRSSAAKLPYSRQVVISTAGFDMSPKAIGYEVYCYARDILTGSVQDDSQFALLIEADRQTADGKAVDPWDPATWRQANPNMGVSVDPVEVGNEANEARQVPSKQPSFLTKRLGWWVQGSKSWLGDMAAYDRCLDPDMDRSMFVGKKAFIGLDLALTRDLTSKADVFVRLGEDGQRHYYVWCTTYLPSESPTLQEGNDTLRVWGEQGHLVFTPGPVMNLNLVRDDVLVTAQEHPGSEVCYDQQYGAQLAADVAESGLAEPVVIRQGWVTQSGPMKEIEAAILSGRFHHNGDPVLRWCFGNVLAVADRNGNIVPDRQNDARKIDAAVATINAVVRAMLSDGDGSAPAFYSLDT